MKLQLNLDRPLIVFDIESTGVNARQDRIIELAAIRIEPDGTETEKCWLLNPGVPIPPETTAIHGISDEMVKDCPVFADKAAEIAAFFKDCDLSGFNSDRFDVPCLEEEFARVGLNFGACDRRHVDVQRIYHKMEPRDRTSAPATGGTWTCSASTTRWSRATSRRRCGSTAGATTWARTGRRRTRGRRWTS